MVARERAHAVRARGTRSRRACRCSTRFMRWPRTSASSRRSPMPGSCQRDTRLASVGRLLRNHSRRALKSGSFSSSVGLDRGRRRTAGSARPSSGPSAASVVAVGPSSAARRRRTRPPRPTARCPRRRCCSWPRRYTGSARRTWWRCPRRPMSCRASSSAMVSMFRQNMPIQLVPSLCSMWPPVGSGALRSNTPMLSSPRKPPWKTFLPSASLRLTHQVKFSSSLWNTRSRKAGRLCRAASARSCRRARPPRPAPAG